MEHTLEERYRAAVRAIPHPKGSPERAAERQRLSNQYEADKYRREGGAPHAIHRLQWRFAEEYYRLVGAFYNGEVEDWEYQQRRVRTLRRYAEGLQELGLASGVFDDAWVKDFARDSLELERSLLPVPDVFTGWTSEDAWLLCNPLRDFSKQFFKRVHSDFGIGRLKEHPEVYGGVAPKQRRTQEIGVE